MDYKRLSGKNLREAPAIFASHLPLLPWLQNLIREPGLESDHVPSAIVLSTLSPQEKMPFPCASSHFCLELGLSEGCCLVGAIGLVYHFCSLPKWLLPPLGFVFCILSEPYSACTVFRKSAPDLIIKKVGVYWLVSTDTALPFLLTAGPQGSAAHLRSIRLSALQRCWKAASTVATTPGSLSLFTRMSGLKCVVRAESSRGVAARCQVHKPSGLCNTTPYSRNWEGSEKV